LTREACALTRLRVSGRMRPGWCGNLSTGLADLGVDIARGRALTIGTGIWNAEFELRCPPACELSSLDLGRLLETRAAAGFTWPLELTAYRLSRSASRGGCLLLGVEASNRVGFLAALLRRLAYHALFPVELRLDSVDETARDQLWLRGIGGSIPTRATERIVTTNLDALVGRRG